MAPQKTITGHAVFLKALVHASRVIVGTLVVAGFWYAVGWALASEALGTALVVLCLGLGPWVVPDVLWFFYRWSGRLRPVHYGLEPFLARCYLNGILHRPGLRPKLYVRAGLDESFLWFESLLGVWGGGRQVWIVTDAWMKLPPAQRKKDWDLRWDQQRDLGFGIRWMRSLEMRFWMGAVFPLEILVRLAQMVLDAMGPFRGLPPLAFWAQRFCWTLKELWFGRDDERSDFWVGASDQKIGKICRYWDSLMLGVWSEFPSHRAHWLWGLLTHPAAMQARRH
jgi:hypothetical protein